MEVILIKAAQLILSLSILVIIHEFGHFILARIFKTRVEKFYLFFDPWFSLFKVKKGETEYGIGWLPLGGYVKISGMIDESMDKEAMKLPAQPYEFRAKKTWQRLLIMVGGVVMNFILAFVIYIAILYAWGDQYLPTANVKNGIMVYEAGEKIGLRNGDKILSVDHVTIENFNKIIPTVLLDDAKTIQVLRDGQQMDVQIKEEDLALLIKSKRVFDPRLPFEFKADKIVKESPASLAGLEKGDVFVNVDGNVFGFYDEFTDYAKSHKGQKIEVNVLRNGIPKALQVQVSDDGTLGFYPEFLESAIGTLQYATVTYGFFESIHAGINKGISTINDYLKQFKLIFSTKTKGYESLGGFIAIGNIFPGMWNWHSFWNMTAFLSIILGVMNLLPIPALDGGHVMFLLFEMITGRKPNDKFMEYAQIAGMALLLSLVLYANGNDIFKLFK